MHWNNRRVFLTAFCWTFAFLMGITVGAYIRLQYGLPKPAELQEYKPIVSTRLLDIRGQLISDFASQRRDMVTLDRIPAYIKDGIVAVEDKRFYRHNGIDVIRLFGMVFYNLRRLKVVQGGSTITQQLARTMFLNMEQTLDRKLKEALLAIEIERSFSKDEILSMYLNLVYFGSGSYGVEAAAQTFFGKSARDLNLVQCATISSFPANATVYSPYRHPENVMKRRNLFLRRLYEMKKVTKAEYDKAIAEPVKVTPAKPRRNEAPYFVEEIRKYLEATYGPEFMYTGGATIHTTLDLRIQRAANTALEKRLAELEKGYKLKHPKTEFDSLSPRDSTLKPEYLQGAVVAIDPKTGGIRAMVGGRSLAQSYFNRATQAKRQAGSAFKVFVYTAAIDHGRTPEDIEEDEPLRLVPPGGGKAYEPKNIDFKYLGPMDLYTALAKSRNIIAVRLISQVGPEVVVAYARRMGIKSELKPYYALALGACEVTPLEMTSAFATLDNDGIRTTPYYIKKVVERSGRVIEEHRPEEAPAISEQTAHTMVSMMRGVVDEGTGHSVRRAGFHRPAAGKTGTTDDYADAWFVGFTPELSCGVWVGYDQRKKMFSGATGGVISAPIWARVMSASPAPKYDAFVVGEEILSGVAPAPDTTKPAATDSAKPAPPSEPEPDVIEGY